MGAILEGILSRSSSLKKATNVTARLLRAWGAEEGLEKLRESPSPRDLEAARLLLLYWEQREVRVALKQGKLKSLGALVGAEIPGIPKAHRGLVVTQGRVPEQDWQRIAGVSYLPVLLASSRLARLLVMELHQVDHRKEVGAVLAMTRRHAWIVRGRQLVKSVVKSCVACRLQDRKMRQQVMGDLAAEQIMQCRPFQYLSLDLMGPFLVKGLGGFSRRTFKVWAAVMVCLATKAVSVWAMKDYSTDAFLLALQSHMAIYGSPSLVVTDRGTQIQAAAHQSPNWDQVQHQTAPGGTAWRFVPPATPWRNGLSERIIGLLKRTLVRQVNSGELLDFVQLEVLLHKAASILNSRPLSARSFTDTDFMAITPRDLLLGAAPEHDSDEVFQQLP